MKGFGYAFRGKSQIDMAPCFFCVHREKRSYDDPCYNCISNEDVALHKPNTRTEFVYFEARSEAHFAVLQLEQNNNDRSADMREEEK